MGMYSGDLTAADFIDRLGLTDIMPPDEIEALEELRSSFTPVTKDNLHIYDIPFAVICGSRDIAQKVFEILEPYQEQISKSKHVLISIESREEA